MAVGPSSGRQPAAMIRGLRRDDAISTFAPGEGRDFDRHAAGTHLPGSTRRRRGSSPRTASCPSGRRGTHHMEESYPPHEDPVDILQHLPCLRGDVVLHRRPSPGRGRSAPTRRGNRDTDAGLYVRWLPRVRRSTAAAAASSSRTTLRRAPPNPPRRAPSHTRRMSSSVGARPSSRATAGIRQGGEESCCHRRRVAETVRACSRSRGELLPLRDVGVRLDTARTNPSPPEDGAPLRRLRNDHIGRIRGRAEHVAYLGRSSRVEDVDGTPPQEDEKLCPAPTERVLRAISTRRDRSDIANETGRRLRRTPRRTSSRTVCTMARTGLRWS